MCLVWRICNQSLPTAQGYSCLLAMTSKVYKQHHDLYNSLSLLTEKRKTKAVFTTGACTRETTRLCVFLLAFGAPCVRKRAEMELPTCWNFQRAPAYMPVTLTGGVKKLVLEGVARAKYDSDCCFFVKA